MISIYHGDGSVSVTVGGIEMGQGLYTKVAQTVAHCLEIPLDKVSIKPSNTMTAPNAIVTGGSSGSEICAHVSAGVTNYVVRLKLVLFCISGS